MIVILDLATEDYFVLDEQATRYWLAIMQSNGDREAAEQAYRSGVDRSDPSSFRDFLASCLDRKFLSAGDPLPHTPSRGIGAQQRARGPLVFEAVRSMVGTIRALRLYGFAETYLAYERFCGEGACLRRGVTSARAQSAFLQAENFVWFPQAPLDCLPRSLALYRFLRALGIDGRHCIGGRRFPGFTMHAWVECEDQVMLDGPEDVGEYTLISSIPR